MSKPDRNSDRRAILSNSRTFFVTSQTSQGRGLLQSERCATLLIDVMRGYVNQGKFKVHDFVVMPNHLHLLLTLDETMSIERAMQFIKGGFSYRLKREVGYSREVWQRGFSEVRINDRASFLQHRQYIEENPVKAGLADSADNYPYGSAYLKKQKHRG